MKGDEELPGYLRRLVLALRARPHSEREELALALKIPSTPGPTALAIEINRRGLPDAVHSAMLEGHRSRLKLLLMEQVPELFSEPPMGDPTTTIEPRHYGSKSDEE